MYIAIDFDGTLVSHEFPKVGKDIGAVPVVKRLIHEGHKIILFTMRSDIDNPKNGTEDICLAGGTYLSDAVNWCKDNGIDLFGINTNPEQDSWTRSPKAYAHLYIDDAGINVPLKYDKTCYRPYVDWNRIEKILERTGILSKPKNNYKENNHDNII